MTKSLITVYERERGILEVNGKMKEAFLSDNIRHMNKWIADKKKEYPDLEVRDAR